MSQPDVTGFCEALDGLQRQRKFYIKLRNKQANAAGALVRQFMQIPYEPTEAVSADEIARMKAVALKIVEGERPEGWERVADEVQGPMEALSRAVVPLDEARHKVELEMRKTARKLPISDWAKSVRGFGELALAVIVAEAGDLSRYSTEAKLWKRLGLAPYKGRAMSNWKSEYGRRGDKALTSDEWSQAGYSPKRRAEIYACVGDPLFRGNSMAKDGSRPSGAYRLVYDRRRAHTAVTHPEAPMKGGQNPPEPCWTKQHQHDDAVRIMTKSLVSDLWSEWRRASSSLFEKTTSGMPDAEPFRMAAE